MEFLQPCDWHEHDIKNEYVVDIYGRLPSGESALLRVTGFKPYFYVSGRKRVPFSTSVEKYDVLAGFNGLQKINVWKVMCNALNQFFQNGRTLGEEGRTLYESNLPPFLRMIHEQNLNPGSPMQFQANEVDIPEKDDEPEFTVDHMYTCNYKELSPASSVSIPMKIASYDLEMYSESGQFPIPSRDPIIQIGVSFRWSNDLMTPIKKFVFVLGSVDPSDEPGTIFKSCPSEKEVLYSFLDCINLENPDIMCGYNTFGFDDGYIEGRCKALGILDTMNLSRAPIAKKNVAARGEKPIFATRFTDTKKFELASGKYDLTPLAIRGRLGIDLLLNMRREHSLDSFKLDSVASVFLRDKVLSYTNGVIKTKSTRGLRVGSYVRFDLVGNTSDPYREGAKFVVSSLTSNSFTIDAPDLFQELTPKQKASIEWTFTKDDVEPHELFRLHREGGPAGRARIAKYCIQDCDLVLTLMNRLDTIVSARGMADVCKVPMSFVLTRGQGIKIFSAVVYYAAQRDQILQTQSSVDDDSSYEGAVVIQPKIGMYLDQPISVLDFNSLYPSNMIAYNLSPDTLVSRRVYDAEHTTILEHEGLSREEIEKYEDQGYEMDEVKYTEGDDKKHVVCVYVRAKPDNAQTVGILPKTLEIMLAKRKEYKNMMEDMKYDEAQRSVFNGLQLAYKVVANSIYGQCGSKTSAIRKLCVAACTTAVGRDRLNFAKSVVEKEFGAEVVYGDTDSIFIKFPTKSLEESIQLGIKAGKRITEQCRKAHKIAYEKTFYPFILFCRKRYVGIKYEEDPSPSKGKRMSMGIVLKRRDNAPIVKDVFGGALDVLLHEKDVKKAQQYVKTMLHDILHNKFPLEKFIISKSLRDDYKNPGQIAHRVLADRMAERDPGTAPKVGDRVQYIYIAENKNASKQGDRIEHIDFVRSNRLVPDTRFYITNQIQNPVAQLFALCIEKLDGFKEPRPSYATLLSDALKDCKGDEEEATLAVLKLKEKQLENLMFLGSPHLSNQKTLTGMWGK